jgi:hypothetical protein
VVCGALLQIKSTIGSFFFSNEKKRWTTVKMAGWGESQQARTVVLAMSLSPSSHFYFLISNSSLRPLYYFFKIHFLIQQNKLATTYIYVITNIYIYSLYFFSWQNSAGGEELVITVVVSVCSKRKAALLLFGFGLLLGGAPGWGDGAARVEPAIGKLLLVSRLHSTGAIRTPYKISPAVLRRNQQRWASAI